MAKRNSELEDGFRFLAANYDNVRGKKGIRDMNLIMEMQESEEYINSLETSFFIRNREIYSWFKKYFLSLTELWKSERKKTPISIIEKEKRREVYEKYAPDMQPFLKNEEKRWKICMRHGKEHRKALDYFIPVKEGYDFSDKKGFRGIIDLSYKKIDVDFSHREEDIEKIRKACEIADKAMEYAYNTIKIGMSEKELKKSIINFIHKQNCELAFSPIVLFDENILEDEPMLGKSVIAGNNKINSGSFALVDIGAKYRGFCSDLTRCFSIEKESSKLHSLLYDFIEESQKKILGKIKAGANVNAIGDYIETIIPDIGPVIHGLGLDIHEDPYVIMPLNKSRKSLVNKLEKNMVLAVEPGIYAEDYAMGVRLEDTVLVKENGYELLTKAPKIKILRK